MDYVESFAAHGEALDVYGAFSGKLEEAAAGSEEAADGLLEVDASRVQHRESDTERQDYAPGGRRPRGLQLV